MTRIELDDGKYTVVHDSGAGLHALRYGEHWRDMTGDGLVLAMAQEIEDLRRRIVPVQQVSVPDVSAMARILADRNADACNVNREDNWMIYGQDYIDDVTAMLAAAPAAPAADAGVLASAENCSFVMRHIASMDAEEIYGDDIDLRFEDTDGRDTGCDVSIVDYAEKTADVLDALIAAHRAKGVV